MEIRRDIYLNRLINSKHNGLIKIVTGIRRCGKSYLLNKIFCNYLKEHSVPNSRIIQLSLDSEEDKKYLDPMALNKYVKSKIKDNNNYYLILDEVQKVKDFVPLLNGFLKYENIDVYVTGSNSKFLSSDIVTEFRGRGYEIHMYPLSFSEFYSAYKGDIYKAWAEYIAYGGLPQVLLHKTPQDKISFVTTLKDNTYLNDVVERNNIRNPYNLGILLQILSSSIGSLINPSKIANSFKSIAKIDISEHTIKSYLKYLKEAFIIENALRFNIKGKKYINPISKFYFSDCGIRNSILSFRQIEETHLMENVIYNELRIRGFNVDIGVIETRETVKDGSLHRKQLEVDFVANNAYKKYYIQSCLDISNRDKLIKECKSFNKIRDNFKKVLIVKDQSVSYINNDGILIINLFDFLLDINSLDK